VEPRYPYGDGRLAALNDHADLKIALNSDLKIISGIGHGEIPGVERRWRSEQKRRVLADSDAPDATVAEVAERHDISRGLLWT